MKKKTIRSDPLPRPIHIGFLCAIFIALSTVGTAPGVGINYSDIYREAIAETGFIGLLLCWVIINRRAQTITLRLSATRLWFSGLLLFATVSGFWAVDIDFFLSKYWLWLAAAAVFVLTLGLSAKTKTHISLSRAIVFVGVYISTIGILQALVGLNVFDQAAAPAANLVNKNMASQIIVLIFPLNLFLLLTDKNKHLSALYPFAMTLMLGYIFHAVTRAAWLGIGTEIILLTIGAVIYKNKFKQALSKQTLHWDREKTLASIAAFVLLLLLFNISADGWSPVWETLIRESTSIVGSAQNSSSPRYIIWSAALSMLEQRPIFGSGMGSFYYKGITEISSLAGNINGVMRTHNDVLELGVELGVIGLILFFGVVVSLVINLFNLIRQDDTQQQLFYLAVGAALAGGAVNMQFSFPYQMPVPLMIFGIYSAFIIKSSDAFGTRIKTITITRNSTRNPNIGSKTGLGSKIGLAGVGFVGIIFIGTLALNTLWLSSFVQMDSNIKRQRWIDPVAINAPVCSKLMTKLLTVIIDLYNNNGKHDFALSALDSFNRCAPDSWKYYSDKAQALNSLESQYKAIEAFKEAIKIHPKGEYANYAMLYAIYYNHTDNKAKALALYQELSAQPEALLAIRPGTLFNLVAMSVDSRNLQQATKFYDMYVKHHGENAQLKALYMQLK